MKLLNADNLTVFSTTTLSLLLVIPMTRKFAAPPPAIECPYICDASAEYLYPTQQLGCTHIGWSCSPAQDGTSASPCGILSTCSGCAQSCTWVLTLNGCTQVAWKWQGLAAQELRGYCGSEVAWRSDIDDDSDGIYDDNWLKHTLKCKCP